MTHVTCRLTAKNQDNFRNPALGNRVWATFTFYKHWQSIIITNLPCSAVSALFVWQSANIFHSCLGSEIFLVIDPCRWWSGWTVDVCRGSVQMFCLCLEWQWVKAETAWSIACLAHRNQLVLGATSMSGTVNAHFFLSVIHVKFNMPLPIMPLRVK